MVVVGQKHFCSNVTAHIDLFYNCAVIRNNELKKSKKTRACAILESEGRKEIDDEQAIECAIFNT